MPSLSSGWDRLCAKQPCHCALSPVPAPTWPLLLGPNAVEMGKSHGLSLPPQYPLFFQINPPAQPGAVRTQRWQPGVQPTSPQAGTRPPLRAGMLPKSGLHTEQAAPGRDFHLLPPQIPPPAACKKSFVSKRVLFFPLLRAKAELSAPTERQEGAVRPILISLRQENGVISANMGLFRALFVHKVAFFFNFALLTLLPSSSPRPLP